MRAKSPLNDQPTAATAEPATILVSFELSQSNRVLTALSPIDGRLSRHTIAAADTVRLQMVLETLRLRAGRKGRAPVRFIAILEAGLDGFWLHRWLVARGIGSHIVDAASIAAPRRRRRAKSDGIDGEILLRLLAAFPRGEPQVCAMVVAPGVENEDRRRLSRERGELICERTALTNRIRGLLASLGIRGYQPLKADRRAALEALRDPEGRVPPPHLMAEPRRLMERIELLLGQLRAVEAEPDAVLREEATTDGSASVLLMKSRGIGPEFATVLLTECFWRRFGNRRQVASFAGLAPTPWRSGGIQREQGISGAGNPRLRRTMVEMAWLWLRYQPGSALSQWFQARARGASPRARRIAIVGLARRPLIAPWRYLTQDLLPEGAACKA
jgi:transposase